MWNKSTESLDKFDRARIERLREKVDGILDPKLGYSDFNAIRSTIANYRNKIDGISFKNCLSEVNNRFEGAMRIRRKLQNCEYKMERILNRSITLVTKSSEQGFKPLLKKAQDIIKRSATCKFKSSDYDSRNKNLFIMVDCSDDDSETIKILSQMGFKKY